MSTAEELRDQGARTAASTLLSECAFIEAGASTGKSTTLVERIINTLTDPAPPPITSIAAITFTDRAGAELRHRLREKVTKRLAKGTDSPANLQLLAAALQDLDAAVIGTIHSFAERILRTHALSARLPIAFAPATGADAAEDERSRVRFAINHVQASLDPRDLSLLAAYGLAPVDLLEVLQRLDAQGLRLHDAAFSQGGTDLDDLCAAAADGFQSFLLAARADCGDPADRLMVAFEERVPPVITLLRPADPADLAACRAATEGTHPVFKLGNVGAAPAWGAGGAKARTRAHRRRVPGVDVRSNRSYARRWNVCCPIISGRRSTNSAVVGHATTLPRSTWSGPITRQPQMSPSLD